MKIYTTIRELPHSTMVGATLANDQNEILFSSGFRITLCDKVSGHMYGVKRCLSYAKANNVNDDVIKLNLKDMVRVDIDRELLDRVQADEYVKRFFNNKSFIVNNKEFDNIDREMFWNSDSQISIKNKTKDYDR